MKLLTAEEIAAALSIPPWALLELERKGFTHRSDLNTYDQESRVWRLRNRELMIAIEQASTTDEFQTLVEELRPTWAIVEMFGLAFGIPLEHLTRFYGKASQVLGYGASFELLNPAR